MNEAAQTAPETEVVTFWDITLQQFRKNRPAMTALRCLIGLIVIAAAAPLISLNIPFVLSTPKGLEWPLFWRLFDRLIFPSGVDIFFNVLLVLGPFWWLGGRLAPALAEQPIDTRRALWAGIPLGLLAILYAMWGSGEQSIFFWLLLAAAVGFLIQLGQAFRARSEDERHRRSIRTQTRVVIALLFVATFVLVLFPLEYTNKVRIYRTEIEELRKSGEGWAIQPPIFYHPDHRAEESGIVVSLIMKPPSLEQRTLLGTDNNGRDVFSRLVYGTRISLTIGVIAVSIYVTIGIILGGLAGYFGGWIDILIVGVLQVMLCIPWLFLLLTIISLFDTRSIFLIMVAIGLTAWPGITRLVRGEFFRQRNIDYVTAAVALGLPKRRIIFGHIMKNSIGPVLVSAAFGVAAAILAESFLSFLGLGDTNAPSWGQILMEGRAHRKDWLILSPGMAIFFVVTILNLVGDGLRDALDPKLRQ